MKTVSVGFHHPQSNFKYPLPFGGSLNTSQRSYGAIWYGLKIVFQSIALLFGWQFSKIIYKRQTKQITSTRITTCLFCGLIESRNHLFFECGYSSLVSQAIVAKCWKGGPIPNTWNDLISWGCRAWKRGAKINFLSNLAWQACVYHIRIEINMRAHKATSQTLELIIYQIVEDVSNRVHGLPQKCIQGTSFGIF